MLYQMKQIDSRKFNWSKAGKLYADNEYQYVIMLKGWLSAVMDDAANGAQQGSKDRRGWNVWWVAFLSS